MSARQYGVNVAPNEMFRERYAYYSSVFTTPDGNAANCFLVSDIDEQPIIDGVIIPADDYTVRKELEIDLSMCNLDQLKGILGKYQQSRWFHRQLLCPFQFLILLLVSLFYSYRRLADLERQLIVRQSRAESTSDLVDLAQLHRLRLDNDTPIQGGFSYAAVGSNQFVDTWVDFGVREGLLSHQWRDDLDYYMELGRGEANKILLDFLQE